MLGIPALFQLSFLFVSGNPGVLNTIINSRHQRCQLIFIDKLDHLISDSTRNPNMGRYIYSNVSTNNSVVPHQFLKFGMNCKLVLIPINHNSVQEAEEYLLRVKAKFASSPLKTKSLFQLNLDKFIFIVRKHEVLHQLLISSRVLGLVKYKIGVTLWGPVSQQPLFLRACLFCNLGKPVVTKFDILQEEEIFPDYVTNLNGKLLRVTFPLVKSWIQVDPPYKGINNAKRGMWKPLFNEFLVPKFNFTYNMFLSPGAGTGFRMGNGSWTGTVGDLLYDRADIGIVTVPTYSRVGVVTFTDSFFTPTLLHFCTRTGEPLHSVLDFLRAFTLFAWGCIILSTILAFLFFKIMTILMDIFPYGGVDDPTTTLYSTRRGKMSHHKWGLRHQILFVTTSYLDQDCDLPQSSPLRCFVVVWLFFTLIVTTLYRSKLVSLLAFPRVEESPQTFAELVDDKRGYQIGFIKHGDAAYNVLKASKDPVYVKLVEKMKIVEKWEEGWECMRNVVEKERYGCLAYDASTFYLIWRNLSDSDMRRIVFATETTFTVYAGLALQPSSIFLESFDKALRWARPFHLTDIWREQDAYETLRVPKLEWWARKNRTNEEDDEGDENDLTMKHIQGAFVLLGLSLCLSGTVFVLEVMGWGCNKFRRKVFDGSNLNRKKEVGTRRRVLLKRIEIVHISKL